MLLPMLLLIAQASQPPIPSAAKPSANKQQATQPEAGTSGQVSSSGAPGSQIPTAQVVVQQTNGTEEGKSSKEDYPALIVSALTLLVLFLQWRVMARQNAITQTQQTIAEEQGKEAQRSIKATENIATAMEINTGITQEISDRQKRVTEITARAYLSADVIQAAFQDHLLNFAADVGIKNVGATPAYKVRFCINGGVIPFPNVPADYPFPLPDLPSLENNAGIISAGQTRLLGFTLERRLEPNEAAAIVWPYPGPGKSFAVWGKVEYEDAFGHQRHLRFGFTVQWQPMRPDNHGNPRDSVMRYQNIGTMNESD